MSEREEVLYKKVKGEANLADLMTKYLTPLKVQTLSAELRQFPREGRAKAGLALNSCCRIPAPDGANSAKLKFGRGGAQDRS